MASGNSSVIRRIPYNSSKNGQDQNVDWSPSPKTELPIHVKIKLLQEYEADDISQRKLAVKYGIGKATVNQIVKNKERFFREYERLKMVAGDRLDENPNWLKQKRIRKTPATCVNEILEEFVETARISKWEISGPKLKERAMMVAGQLGVSDFKASNGWLESFKKRCSLEFNGNSHKKRKKNNECNILDVACVEINHNPAKSGHLPDVSTTVIQALGTPPPSHEYDNGQNVQTDAELDYINNLIQRYQSQQRDQMCDSSDASATGIVSVEIIEGEPSSSNTNPPLSRSSKQFKSGKCTKDTKLDQVSKKSNKEMHSERHREVDGDQLVSPHIGQVRDAVDTLERFSLTKMPDLLPSIMSIRQEIGAYVIQQQQQK